MADLLIKKKTDNIVCKRGEFIVGGFPMMVEENRQDYFIEVVDVSKSYDDTDGHNKVPINIDANRILTERDNPYEHAEESPASSAEDNGES